MSIANHGLALTGKAIKPVNSRVTGRRAGVALSLTARPQ